MNQAVDHAQLEARCRSLAIELDLLPDPNTPIEVSALTGGVASDIALVAFGERRVCMKFALAKLRVAAPWYAPVHRNAAEYAWLKVASNWRPENVPMLFGRSQALQGFAMEFIEGADVYLWKTALLAEAPDHGEAAMVGDLLGALHAASTADGFDATPFQNHDDFWALRLEPYLSYTATQHLSVAPQLNQLAATLRTAGNVLVHGDVSPKNILMRKSGPIVLDAECATMGDASFDPAFCLNHLLLKAVHLPASRERLLASLLDFWQAYGAHVKWEASSTLEARICALLPCLFLARVDGKSPVEYLDEQSRNTVRQLALALIGERHTRLADTVGFIGEKLRQTEI